jgi:hypothetical protein
LKEAKLSSWKAKQSVLNLTSLGKRTVAGELTVVESKTLDLTVKFHLGKCLAFKVANSPSFAAIIDQCIQFGQQNIGRKYKVPKSAQVFSASSFERNWSAHGHIHSEVRNRLAPATTEKLMYIHSNRKAAAAASDDELMEMFTGNKE